uniref:Putative LAGLIDADG homing endonuclease n=1 Tax=Floydiella terrestris TaxID=51328 RepID=E2DSH2_FLOTE|nr:putative LAGLIDADG homing endonuclease [Floydiella terrestris]ACZ58499.1 putative LAGLIDADG homing endonuclease [Floydiella terrestris]
MNKTNSDNLAKELIDIASCTFLKKDEYENFLHWKTKRDGCPEYQAFLKRTKRTLYSNSLNLDPYFIVGLVESDGSFFLGIEGSTNKIRPYFSAFLNTENKQDREVVTSIQGFFGVGNVTDVAYKTATKEERTGVKFEVNTVWECFNVICPFFEQFPLKGEKLISFLKWREALKILVNDAGLLKSNKFRNVTKAKLYHYAFNINPNSSTRKKELSEVLASVNQKDTACPEEISIINSVMQRWMDEFLKSHLLPSSYISGLVCGDGCFTISMNSVLKSIQISFSITTPDIKLLFAVRKTLGIGNVFTLPAPSDEKMSQRGLKKANDCYRYGVFSKEDFINVLIPFFKNSPVFGSKGEAFTKLSDVLLVLKSLASPTGRVDYNSTSFKKIEQEIKTINRKGRYRRVNAKKEELLLLEASEEDLIVLDSVKSLDS